jgi:hypothetical protein
MPEKSLCYRREYLEPDGSRECGMWLHKNHYQFVREALKTPGLQALSPEIEVTMGRKVYFILRPGCGRVVEGSGEME